MVVLDHTATDESAGLRDHAYPGDAGTDLPVVGNHILTPGERKDLPTGIRVAIPEGYYGRIIGRSSSIRKKNILVYEGIIDSGFRGELFSYVENVGRVTTAISNGDRVAQLIVCPVTEVSVQRRSVLSESTRGTNGFGSSDERTAAKLALNASYGKEVQLGTDRLLPMVYLGGPIDGAEERQWLERYVLGPHFGSDIARWYDPKSECQGIADPTEVWNKNEQALVNAEVAFFRFDGPKGHYGFGSPIEIYQRAISRLGPTTIVYCKAQPGVYLRRLWKDFGVLVTDDIAEAERLLHQAIMAAR